MAAAMIALLLVYGTWQLFRFPPGDRRLVGDAFFLPVNLAAILAAMGASRRAGPGLPRVRRAWQLVAVASALYLAGDLVQTGYEVRGPLAFPAIDDVLYLLFYPVMFAALLHFAQRRTGRREHARLALDLAIVALGGAMLLGYLVVHPILRDGWSPSLSAIVSLAYPVGDMVVLLGLGSALLRPTDASSTAAVRCTVAALAFFIAADVLYAYLQQRGEYQGGDPIDSLWMIAIALSAVAGCLQTRVDPRSGGRAPDPAPQTSWMPNLASALGFGLLIVDHNDATTTIAAVALACLVAARQFLVQHELLDHQRLARHHSLHDSLTGLANRRRLIGDLQQALSDASATSERHLAIFDLDGFKAYNDARGHLAGDALLVRAASRLNRLVAPHGRAYRLGGDEFCVLLDSGVPAPAALLADAAVALCETADEIAIRASAGMVAIPAEAGEVSAILHLADTRMYEQKGARREATIVAQTRDVLLRAAAEHTDDLTEHMTEVGELAWRVALRLGLDANVVELTARAGELHDVGKLGIPAAMLAKPGPFDTAEWALVREHTLIGERILGSAPALRPIAEIVRSAHERFDGGGYPDGLAGERIPLPARIVFACDAYHAMREARAYAGPVTVEQACDELRRGAGTQFDPRVVDALLAELSAVASLAPETGPPLVSTRAA